MSELTRELGQARRERDEARRQLAEASEAARLLMAWGKARYQDDMTVGDPGTFAAVRDAYRALPAWMRKEIER